MKTRVAKVVRSLENIGSSSHFAHSLARGLALSVALGAGGFASAADYYVSTNDVHAVEGSELGWGTYVTDDGESHNAYTNLQQAVDAATKNGDTVWVEDGFVCDDSNGYYDAGTSSNYPLRWRLRIGKNITLRSRSGKWENGPVILGKWEPGWEAKTTLTDQLWGAYGSNSVAGVTATSGTKIRGFRIENTSRKSYGEGAVTGNPTLENCLISGARASYFNISATALDNCVISNCYGGKYAVQCPKITNTLFVDNYGFGENAALCGVSDGGIVSNCTFAGTFSNINHDGVVTFFSTTNSAVKGLLVDCVFTNNTARCIRTNLNSDNAGVISNCVFVGNEKYIYSPNWAGGHCMDFYNCKFIDNKLNNAPLFYGGCGGRLYNCLMARNDNKAKATWCFWLINNTAAKAPLRLYNCTIVSNVVAGALVGVSTTQTSQVYAVNTIFSGNTAGQVSSISGATNCCLMANLEETMSGNGNVFTDDPKLVADGERMYRPKGGSPCLGTGSLTAYELPAHDLSGRSRLTNGKVSIGCYEPLFAGLMLIVR